MALSRRRFLAVSAALGAGVAAANLAPAQAATVYNGEAVVDGYTIVRGSWDVAGLTVSAGAVLEFDPAASTTIRSSGSIVVYGTLRQKPDTAAVTHRIQFVNVDEAAMLGGAEGGPDTDTGLWFYGMAMWDACGTERKGWNRTGTDATWLPGDEIRVAPSAAGNFTSFPLWAGGTVPSYQGQSTEVFNLTRNVIVGGTPGHRAHVMFMMTMAPQMVCHVRLENMGPRQADPDNEGKTRPVLSRYPFHFHHCGDGSRGSVIEGLVAVDSGSRSFVPHNSHGVTLRDCVAYGSATHPYWWDPDKNNDPDTGYSNHTDDVLYEHCAAFKVGPQVKADKGQDQYRLTGFLLGQGSGNTIRGCVTAGVANNGAQQTSGFYWDENANPFPNVWVFEDCVAHNNERAGFFVWQNDPRGETVHHPTGLIAWRNGEAGVVHGAYTNDYRYTGLTLLGNGKKSTDTKTYPEAAGLVIHAGITDTYTGGVIDADGRADSCINVQNHQAAAIATSLPVIVRDFQIDGWAVAPVVYDAGKPTGKGGWIDFVNITVGPTARPLAGSDFAIRAMPTAERVRVQDAVGNAFQIYPDGSTVPIPAFA